MCRLNANGTISIIDRASALFKPRSIGTFVSPDYLQAMYLRSQLIRQMFVYGSSFHFAIVAVVVPDRDRLLQWMADKGCVEQQHYTGTPSRQLREQYRALCQQQHAEIKQMMRAALAAQEAGTIVTDRVRDFVLDYDVDEQGLAFTADNGLLVPQHTHMHAHVHAPQHSTTTVAASVEKAKQSVRLPLHASTHSLTSLARVVRVQTGGANKLSRRAITHHYKDALQQLHMGLGEQIHPEEKW